VETANRIVKALFDSLKDSVKDLNQLEKEKINELLYDLVISELEYMTLDEFLDRSDQLTDEYSKYCEKYFR